MRTLLVIYLFSMAYEFVLVHNLLHQDNDFLLKEFHLKNHKITEFLVLCIASIRGPISQCERVINNYYF